MKTRPVLTGVASFLALGLMLYFCALPGDLPADTDTGTGLVGTYTVNGVDPLGVEYSGTVVIRDGDSPNTFLVDWLVTGGIHTGIGTRTGNRFDVEWDTIASGGGTGSGNAVYDILDDGRLIGTRTVDGFDKAGTEEIFPDP